MRGVSGSSLDRRVWVMARDVFAFRTIPGPPGQPLALSGPLPGAGIEILDEDDLLAADPAIRAALRDNPQFGPLLFVNPVMVLIDLGFTLSPAMQRHASRQLSLGAEVSDELDALADELQAAIDSERRLVFSNPRHVATIVFELLGVQPRATAGVAPPVRPASEVVDYSGEPGPLVTGEGPIRQPRPTSPRARRHTRRTQVRRGTTIMWPQYRPRHDFIDLDAALPQLEHVEEAPDELPLEQLIFYRDDHPLIPKLVRYQQLFCRRLVFATPEQYRAIRDGERGSMWRSWLGTATFPRTSRG